MTREQRTAIARIISDMIKADNIIEETEIKDMKLLMSNYLDEDFKPEYLDLPADFRSEEYYVNMMTAWLFAEALVKQWDITIKYIEGHRLDKWTHNKAIQKACESFRVSDEKKEYLRRHSKRYWFRNLFKSNKMSVNNYDSEVINRVLH